MPRMPRSSFFSRSSSITRRAFTLIELMISIAIALLLMVGINQVFKTTAQTVGTSYATLDSARKQIALDNVFDRDFDAASNVSNTSQPAIIIHSTSLAQYWDATEANADLDGDLATIDLDGDGKYTSAGEAIAGAADLRSNRVHRVDSISFFARDVNVPYRSQTAIKLPGDNGDRLVSDETSSEAWIWYGFLWLPTNPAAGQPTTTADFLTLAAGTAQTNPNNYYARDWALGRQAILLKSDPTGAYLTDTGGSLPPLGKDTPANTGSWLAKESRFDIAKGTIRTLHTKFSNVSGTWQDPMDYRFYGKPWVDPTATDRSAELAWTVPFLTRGVNQFIVEFAGDFISQDNDPVSGTYGNPTLGQPDGILDFTVDSNGIRRTRWYGFPRDVAGPINTNNPTGGPDGKIDKFNDVVPVRDLAGGQQPFEKTVPGQQGNYLNPPIALNALASSYIVAWSAADLKAPDIAPVPPTSVVSPSASNSTVRLPGPWMIRIVLNVRDSNNRLPDGQTIEHVYALNK